MRLPAGLLACAVLVLAPPTPAAATEVSGEGLRALAAAARNDPAALERLRAVTAVDGEAVAIAAALSGAEGRELDRRLAELQSAGEAGPGEDAEQVRARAGRVLAELAPDQQPEAGGEEGDSWFDLGTLPAPGGAMAWVLLAAAAIAGGLLAIRLARGRELQARLAGEAPVEPGDARRRDLEAEAAAAETAGEYARAVRLRFAAAVGRLQELGVLSSRPSLTGGEVAAALAGTRAPELIRTFERVAYGGAPAGAGEAERAREGWARVLDQARDRR